MEKNSKKQISLYGNSRRVSPAAVHLLVFTCFLKLLASLGTDASRECLDGSLFLPAH